MKLFQALGYGKLDGVRRILLGYYAVEGRVVLIGYAVGRVVGQYLTVCKTQREVGIRRPRLVGLHAHQAGYVAAVSLVVDLAQRRELCVEGRIYLVDRGGEHDGRVGRYILLAFDSGAEALERSELRVVVEIVDVCVRVAAEAGVDHIGVYRRQLRYVLAEYAQHAFGYGAVHLGVVVLVEVGQCLAVSLGKLLSFERLCRGCGAYELYGAVHGLAYILHSGRQVACLSGITLDHGQSLRETLLGQGVGGSPGREGLLLSELLRADVEFLDAARHADRVLPVVRRLSVLGGVLYAYRLILVHERTQYLLTLAAYVYALRVGYFEHVVDLVRGHVALRRAGESHYHGEVALVVSFQRYVEPALGLVGHVVLRVCRRTVVLAGIYAEYREVARVARPHPVVRVAAELAYRRGRGTHQTHVGIYLVDECEELVVAEEARHDDLHAGILRFELFGQGGDVLLRDSHILILAGDRRDVADDIGRNVDYMTYESHFQTRCGQLALAVLGPESVGQIVVVDRRELLDRRIAAVVVGKEQAVGRNDLAGAAAAEYDDRILQRALVGRVDVVGRETAALGAHLFDVHLFDVGQQPHALVCCGRERDPDGREDKKQFFHIRVF